MVGLGYGGGCGVESVGASRGHAMRFHAERRGRSEGARHLHLVWWPLQCGDDVVVRVECRLDCDRVGQCCAVVSAYCVVRSAWLLVVAQKFVVLGVELPRSPR